MKFKWFRWYLPAILLVLFIFARVSEYAYVLIIFTLMSWLILSLFVKAKVWVFARL